ncbi:hypothetical protein [Amycolatopsis albispora]|uniref:Integral membrane protein n=1 Tax=Amycolatopsis albispora TaxID=1804986 RepID=A0A344LC18_9PSEU|nr:hypothetical protein [Amycolatopsis albispora]AXB45592.1 hypothetical protein A4R43_26430 [Amycolatopsis albispora]
MINGLATALIIATLVGAVWVLVHVLRNRPPNRPLYGALAVLELGLLVQSVAGIVNFANTDRPVNGPEFIAYLAGILVILPIAVLWSMAERTRWGTGVLLVACLVLPVMIVRMQQIWELRGA